MSHDCPNKGPGCVWDGPGHYAAVLAAKGDGNDRAATAISLAPAPPHPSSGGADHPQPGSDHGARAGRAGRGHHHPGNDHPRRWMDPELRQHPRRKRAAGRRSRPWHVGQRQPPAHHGGNRGLRRRHACSRDPILRPDRRSMAHIRDYERGNRRTIAAPDRLPGRGISGFTTLTVELVYNGGVMPNVWQDNVLDDETIVWQTTDDGGFCNNSTFCTFGEFKQQYPDGRFTFLTVAIGTGVPAATSYTDGVSLTINEDGTETTETFDFEVVAAPTAAPTVAPPDPAPATAVPTAVPAPGGGGGGSLPDTAAGDPGSGVSVVLGSLVLISAVTTAIAWRRRLSR